MNKNRLLIYAMIAISIILCIPSIGYLITNTTVDGFNGYYTFSLIKSDSMAIRVLSGIVVIGLLALFSWLYFGVVKKEKKIFKNNKQVVFFIMLISFLFMLILPFFSSDIYYYIGDSWLEAKYGENPYYTSVADLKEKGIHDEILDNTGYWEDTTSVYGPLWSKIASVLSGISFGNLTLALFIFKIAAYVVHILNCYTILKLTKSTKYMLLYGLNPLILIEFLCNVHNDIYLICFILLALYYLIRRKNIYLTILFLALSISIKFSTVLLVPFVLIYYFRNKTIPKRIGHCLISGLCVIGIVVLLYLPYLQDITIFTNMLVQGSKYSQSIQLNLLLELNSETSAIVSKLVIPFFAILYVTSVAIMLFKKKINIKEILKNYNFFMFVFIFIVLTNFQRWYVIWLIPTIMWQSKYMRQFILNITVTAVIPTLHYFPVEAEPYMLGRYYSIEVLGLSLLMLAWKWIKDKKFKIKEES